LLTFYINNKDYLQSVTFEEMRHSKASPIWVDFFDPTLEEEKFLKKHLKIAIPNLYEMSEIELSNRLYQANDSLYVTGSFINNEQKTQAITFILSKNFLITLRYTEFSFFARYLNFHKKNGHVDLDFTDIFIGLLEAAIGQIADYIEEVGHSIDETTRVVFHSGNTLEKHTSKVNFKKIIHQIGNNGDLISKTHESLMSIYRIINFISEAKKFKLRSEDSTNLKIVMNDIPPLNDQATFLSNKVNFLLDACLGMINIDQNTIIKVVSVAAIIFFPPTLVASIYGMNFKAMPELSWDLGYPLALVLMLLSALLPFVYFKYKDWI